MENQRLFQDKDDSKKKLLDNYILFCENLYTTITYSSKDQKLVQEVNTDEIIKTILVGHAGVGKTTLFNLLNDVNFS